MRRLKPLQQQSDNIINSISLHKNPKNPKINPPYTSPPSSQLSQRLLLVQNLRQPHNIPILTLHSFLPQHGHNIRLGRPLHGHQPEQPRIVVYVEFVLFAQLAIFHQLAGDKFEAMFGVQEELVCHLFAREVRLKFWHHQRQELVGLDVIDHQPVEFQDMEVCL